MTNFCDFNFCYINYLLWLMIFSLFAASFLNAACFGYVHVFFMRWAVRATMYFIEAVWPFWLSLKPAGANSNNNTVRLSLLSIEMKLKLEKMVYVMFAQCVTHCLFLVHSLICLFNAIMTLREMLIQHLKLWSAFFCCCINAPVQAAFSYSPFLSESELIHSLL